MKQKIFLILFLTHFSFILNPKGVSLYITDKTKQTISHKKNEYQLHLKSLDNYYSDKKLGGFVFEGKTIFRLFAPQAERVFLCTFKKPEDNHSKDFEMAKDSDGVWEYIFNHEYFGIYYGYKIFNKYEHHTKEKPLCLDPYAKAVTSFNNYLGQKKGIVIKENDFDWENDEWIQRDWRDLIIYEMHVRDMTAHHTSEAFLPGTYQGLIEKNIAGGINYIKSLGVNTVELLPCHEFANIELPYMDSLLGRKNTWNPYERNHWGYMTSNFFSPEAYYSENWKKLEWNVWEGKLGTQVNHFKNMVKEFHKENIAVVMDVVFNHLSEYENGNLKEIDKEYYFRIDDNGKLQAQSGCGNDLKTERPMVRKLIVESILYWMKEYHIDGFRFDLGKLIDWETIEEISYQAKKINPNVILVCEPWGGGYDPMGFSLRGWGSWNDQIRNGIKGENPFNGMGWIFGKWYGNNNPNRIKSYVNGTLTKDKFGLFQCKEHSINYLESHDGYTLGDFIRIASKEIDPSKTISNVDDFVKLSPLQLRLNKLAALFLFTSQGVTMIHSGQEFARSKIIPINVDALDKHKGKIDHNSYDKDNETNYINYTHAKSNEELLNYYKGLIKLRLKFETFRKAEYEEIKFFEIKGNEFAAGFYIKHKGEEFVVVMNSNPTHKELFHLPKGEWEILANPSKAGLVSLGKVKIKIEVESISGYILKKIK